MATVDASKIDSYADTWTITDTYETAGDSSKFANLIAAVAAANAADRDITLVFSNLEILPDFALQNCDAAKIELSVAEDIGGRAFNCANAVVTAPNLRALRGLVFAGFNGSFEIADCMLTISEDAFEGSGSSMTVTSLSGDFEIDNGVLYSPSNGVVYRCFDAMLSDDASVTLPSLTGCYIDIADYAFEGCRKLKSIIYAGMIERIGSSAFENCVNLSTVNIPEINGDIRDNAFKYCTNLSTLNIPVIRGDIGFGAFYGCEGLNSLDIEAVGGTIAENAFAACATLINVNIGQAYGIGENAFAGCPILTTVTIGDVSDIAYGAFENCSELTTMTLGSTEISDAMYVDASFIDYESAEDVTLTLYQPIYGVTVEGGNRLRFPGSSQALYFNSIVVNY